MQSKNRRNKINRKNSLSCHGTNTSYTGLWGSKSPLLMKWCGGHTRFSFYMLVLICIPPLFCGVFVFIPTLFCGVFVFVPPLFCGVFLYSYIVLWCFCFHSYIVLWCFSLFLHRFVVFFFILTLFCGVFL